MDGADADALMRAARRLYLPPDAGLAFSAVTPASAQDLPPQALGWAARRRDGFVAGRRAAAMALARAGRDGSGCLRIGKDGLPDWPGGWTGSISHTGLLAGAIAARATIAPVLGLDIERLIPPKAAAEIAAAVMPEAAPGAPGLSLCEEITRVFSAKEALYKALFPMTRQFRDFAAARIDWTGGPHLILAEDWSPEWPAGTWLAVHQTLAGGHVLSIVWR